MIIQRGIVSLCLIIRKNTFIMEDFEKEIIMKNVANMVAIEAAMGKSVYLGDPGEVKKNSTPPKNMKGNNGSHLIAENPTPSK